MKTIAVMSGKGGVGKTTISLAIAKTLAKEYKVGLFDADITGSNAHKPCKIIKNVDVDFTINPPIEPALVELDGLKFKLYSFGLFTEDYVYWDSKEYGNHIKQIFENTNWDVDYLIVDTPPGTHEEVKQVLSYADCVFIVTIPSELSYLDSKKTLELVKDKGKPLCGVIVNMDYVVCPNCDKHIKLFNHDLGDLSKYVVVRVPFCPGKIPNLPKTEIIKAIDNPFTFKTKNKKYKFIKSLLHIVNKKMEG